MHEMHTMAGHEFEPINSVFLHHIHHLSDMSLAAGERRTSMDDPLRALRKLSAIVLPVI